MKKRELLLFEDVLILLKIENDKFKYTVYKGHIQVSGSMHLT